MTEENHEKIKEELNQDIESDKYPPVGMDKLDAPVKKEEKPTTMEIITENQEVEEYPELKINLKPEEINNFPVTELRKALSEIKELKKEVKRLTNALDSVKITKKEMQQETTDIAHAICKEFMNSQTQEIKSAFNKSLILKLGGVSFLKTKNFPLREIK